MGRPRNEEVPEHPAIDREIVVITKHGKNQYAVSVTCPGCKQVRVLPLTQVRAAVGRRNFTGRCDPCRAPRPRNHMGPGVSRLPDGTVIVREAAITSGDELALYTRALHSTTPARMWLHMSEWTMVKWLGRPLRPYETVRWRNGDRHDHRLENLDLRISDGTRERSVLRELEWGRQLRERYTAYDEEQLRRAAEHVTEVQESEPQDAERIGPSTIASTSSNVSPAE